MPFGCYTLSTREREREKGNKTHAEEYRGVRVNGETVKQVIVDRTAKLSIVKS